MRLACNNIGDSPQPLRGRAWASLSRIVVSAQSPPPDATSFSCCAGQVGFCKRPGGACMVASELRPESSVVAEARPSPNHSERKGGDAADMVLLHATGMTAVRAAIRRV